MMNWEWLNTSWNKAAIFGCAALVVLGNAIWGRQQNNWVDVVAVAAGAFLGFLTPNKNMPTLKQGQVVVANRDVKDGGVVIATYRP